MPDNTPVETLPFPLSPEYCSGPEWDTQAALREVIANALDEDPKPRVEHTGGWLEVEDTGTGLPRQGLILGVSRDNRQPGQRKGADQVGQFGEGLKIAALVLARQGVPMRVETAGYAFEPRIAHNERMGTDVLHLDFFPCERTSGTLVRMRVRADVARRAADRFRHLKDDYEPPTGTGLMIDDGRGDLYVGGVFIRRERKLAFSYDFALTDHTKGLQNRDRTIIDSGEVRRAIALCHQELDDERLIEKLARRAIAGRLSADEQNFSTIRSPRAVRTWKQVGKRIVGDQKAVWVDSWLRDTETLLDLQDRGFTVIAQKIEQREHRELMRLLGVARAQTMSRRVSERRADKSKTEWTDMVSLTDAERATFEKALGEARSVWGENCFGKGVLLFESHIPEAGDGDSWRGFYMPGKDKIAIKRSLLNEGLEAFCSVLTHELAHRLAKRAKSEWVDRTRGFEDQLCDMLGQLLAERAHGDQEPSSVNGAVVQRQLPSERVAALIEQRMNERGITSARALGDEAGISAGRARDLLKAQRSLSPEPFEAVCEVLGLRYAPLFLAQATHAMALGTRRKDGRLYGSWCFHVDEALDSLRALGDEFSEQALLIDTHARLTDDTLPFRRSYWADGDIQARPYGERLSATRDSSWLAPYHQLIDAEITRVETEAAAETLCVPVPEPIAASES